MIDLRDEKRGIKCLFNIESDCFLMGVRGKLGGVRVVLVFLRLIIFCIKCLV